MDPNANRLLTPDEVAEMLDVKPQTLAVWRCQKRQDLPYIKVGHKIRYRLRDVEAWLERQTVGTTETR
jgi:excisionase family DNA binding protein